MKVRNTVSKDKVKINIFCLENLSFFLPTSIPNSIWIIFTHEEVSRPFTHEEGSRKEISSRKVNILFLIIFHTGEGSP